MKKLLKGLGILLFILIIAGSLFCIYLLNAPPIAEPGTPTLQVPTRTAIRGRPTVNSKPIRYTKDVYLFSIDRMYLSNLGTGIFSNELLFNVGLGQRSIFSPELLDKELKTVFNWQKMFADSGSAIQLKSKSPKIKVLISGKDWVLTDSTGAGFAIQKNRNDLEIYLPNLNDAFNTNEVSLSTDVEFSIEEKGKRWSIQDKTTQQIYEIKNGTKRLDVLQKSKYQIRARLFRADLTLQTDLSEGTIPTALRKEFESQKIPLSTKAKLIANDDDSGWQLTDGGQKYDIQKEEGWLQVNLNLESRWLRLAVSSNIKGWVKREGGTVNIPPQPTPSSRQQLKQKLINSL